GRWLAVLFCLPQKPPGPIWTSVLREATCCCSGAKPPARRRWSRPRPTPSFSCRGARGCVRSMSRWPPRSPPVKRSGKPAECPYRAETPPAATMDEAASHDSGSYMIQIIESSKSDCSGAAMKWLGVLLFSACIVAPAAAQSGYPNRPVTLIVTSAPGGVTDVTGRALAQGLTEAWGQPVIVENKGGAAHIIGAGAVAKSAPDGYTLLVGESGTFAVNPTLIPKDKVPYDAEKDFLPISGLVHIYQSLLAAKSLPVANAAELIALAKREPDRLTYGTAGVGTALHMNGELFARMAGIHLVSVHYRGAAPALHDLIAC